MFNSNFSLQQPDFSTAKSDHQATPPRRQRGQGMTEYIIIVALIAVAAIGVYKFFGQTVRSQTAGLAKELAGENATAEITAAGQAAKDASDQKAAKTLKSYNGGN